MSELIFLHGAHHPHCEAVVDKHFDGYYSLQFMARGALDLWYDRRAHPLAGRWCWTAFPGPWIRFRRAESCASWDHRYVAIRGPQVAHWIAEGLFPKVPQRPPDEESFAGDFDRLLMTMQRPDRWSQRLSVNLLERLLLGLAQVRIRSEAGHSWLERVMQTLSQPEPYVISAVARQAGMGISTLRRRFRAATGVSLHVHVVACRIASAKQLLISSQQTIAAISEQLGYHDPSFFTKQFTSRVGVTPGAYRRQQQGDTGADAAPVVTLSR